jgi:hypothetical protein
MEFSINAQGTGYSILGGFTTCHGQVFIISVHTQTLISVPPPAHWQGIHLQDVSVSLYRSISCEQDTSNKEQVYCNGVIINPNSTLPYQTGIKGICFTLTKATPIYYLVLQTVQSKNIIWEKQNTFNPFVIIIFDNENNLTLTSNFI